MRAHTEDFKREISLYGRQQYAYITYEQDGKTIKLSNELNEIDLHYDGALLSSVIKQLDLDSNIDIPKDTKINCQYGIKVRDTNSEDFTDDYDFIDLGNYYVYSSERQEDTRSYKIVCYDKLLYTMVDYESFIDKYPVTIREYLTKLCDKVGIEFANKSDTFPNYDKQIRTELYLDDGNNSLNYTYRAVLDELAQATGSVICINDKEQLEIRYITETSDSINESYFKDSNVTTGKKYGPINSIVLSRSAESDNVYLRDDESVQQNGLCELKINDNQIMNFNDRADYLPDLLDKLKGTEFYLNDFSLTGVCYYDLCDRFTVNIGENSYSCVMLSDEIDITQGLEEMVKTEEPQETETDYKKADKDDRKINQAYLIIDKQNQKIESLVSQTTTQDNKIATIEQTVDDISSKVNLVADITTESETNIATVTTENIVDGVPLNLVIYPNGEDISYLYPNKNIFPSSKTYLKVRYILFKNTETNEEIKYTLPDNLWYLDNETYDEFRLDYENSKCQVIKRVGWNDQQEKYKLPQEIINNYDYPDILLKRGVYSISLVGYNTGHIYVKFVKQNDYTDVFATKVELNSSITQTKNDITLDVNGKLDTQEKDLNAKLELKVDTKDLISEINASADVIRLNSNRLIVNSDNFKVTEDGTITATNGNFNGTITSQNGTIGGFLLGKTDFNGNFNGLYNYNNYDLCLALAHNLGIITLKNNTLIFNSLDVDNDGDIDSTDYLRIQRILLGTLQNTKNMTGKIDIKSNNPKECIDIKGNNNIGTSIGTGGVNTEMLTSQNILCTDIQQILNNRNIPFVAINGSNGYLYLGSKFTSGAETSLRYSGITTPSLTQTSLSTDKKNFEKFNNVLEKIKNIDIYKYNLKFEDDKAKKHIGFVIGDDYNYSEEVTNNENNGVDIYSFVSLCCQAIKEQQKEIEELKEQLKEVKNGTN